MKKIFMLALAAMLSVSVALGQNGLENVVVEVFYIADANDATAPEPIVEGATTYRVYIDMAPGWEFQALYAENNLAENKLDTLKIESTEPFFNNEDRGETFGYSIGTNRLDDGTVMVDSYLSTGRTSEDTEGVLKDEDTDGAIENGDGFLQNDDPAAGTPISVLDGNIGSTSTITFSPTPGFETQLEEIFGEDDQAGSSLVATDAALGLTESLQGPTADNRVLIGQFTTHGDFSFELNVQLRNTASGTVEQWVARTPQAGQYSIPELIYPVPVNEAPTAEFTATPMTGTAPLMVDFDASASSDADGTIASYDWDFGDNNTGTGETATNTYNDPGTYTVTLTVTDDDGATATATATITVMEPANMEPTASFTATPTTGTAPLMVGVDASASSDADGMITSYDWDFGNGTIGMGETANATYTDAGTYTVTLTVTDDDGATATATATITVMEPANIGPTASFTATPENGDAPLDVDFDASASSDTDGTIASYDWDFGNGTTGTGVTANATYTDPGTYTVTLTVTDNDGATATAEQTITVSEPVANMAPTASFSAAPTSGTPPLVVNFNASTSTDSDGTIASYDWDFGDGNTGTGVTATHTYTTAGTFTVTLTVTDDDGATDTDTQTIDLAPANEAGLENVEVELFYIADDNDASAPQAVVEGAVTYRVYVDMAPNWEFQALYAENNPAENKIDVLKIESSEPFFNNEDRGATFGYEIGTDRLDEGTVMIDSYLSTGRTSEDTEGVLKDEDTDGAIANADGYLQNDDPLAGTPISEKDGNIPSNSGITFSATPGFETALDAIFGDTDQGGSELVVENAALGLTESLQGPTADNRVLIGQFTTHGQFCFELNVQLRNTITGEVQQWVAQTPQADQYSIPELVFCSNEAPTAAFTATPTSGTAPLAVDVDASASSDADGTIESYAWDFGNGTTGTGVNASTTYTDAGTYTITLTVTDNDGATATATETITVDEPANEAPTAAFTATPTSGTAPLAVDVDASASSDPDGTIESYAWDFGNGTTGTGVNASTTYTDAGTYTITLTVTDNDGATATATETITVDEPANQAPNAAFTATPTSGTAPLAVDVDASASSDADGTIESYAWDFGNGTTGTGVNASTSYTDAGTYTITLTVTDNDGATDTATRTITVTDGGTGTARVQFIHAAPTETVLVEINGVDYGVRAYWTATPYVDVPAGAPTEIRLTPVDPFSTAAPVTISQTFIPDETYVVTFYGTWDESDNIPIAASVFAGSRETVGNDDVGLLLSHASPDQQEVDVVLPANGSILFDNVEYGTYNDDYTVVPAAIYTIDLTPANDNTEVLHKYRFDISFWKGKTAVIFATGFEGDGTFQPWVALSNGGTFPLFELPLLHTFGGNDEGWIHHALDPTKVGIKVFPNPANDVTQVSVKLDLETPIVLELFNNTGQRVAGIYDGIQGKGINTYELNTSELPAGMYYVKMTSDLGPNVKPLVVIK